MTAAAHNLQCINNMYYRINFKKCISFNYMIIMHLMHSLNILNHLTHQAGEEGVFLIAVYAWCIRCLEIHFKLYGHTFVTMKYYEEKKHIFPLM